MEDAEGGVRLTPGGSHSSDATCLTLLLLYDYVCMIPIQYYTTLG